MCLRNLVSGNVPLGMIQTVTGHSNINQTLKYIESETMKPVDIEPEGVVALLAQRENAEDGQRRQGWPKGQESKMNLYPCHSLSEYGMCAPLPWCESLVPLMYVWTIRRQWQQAVGKVAGAETLQTIS